MLGLLDVRLLLDHCGVVVGLAHLSHLWGVGVTEDQLVVAVGLRGREALGVPGPEQVVVGGGELDDGWVLTPAQGAGRLSRAAGVDQYRAVRVGHHSRALLINSRGGVQTPAPPGVDYGWPLLLLEGSVLAGEDGTETLAGGRATVGVELDAALVVVVVGVAQDLGDGEAHAVGLKVIQRLSLNGRSCEETEATAVETQTVFLMCV